MVLRRGKQMIVDFKARLFLRSAIKAAEVCKKIKLKVRGRFKKRTDVCDVFARHNDRSFAERFDCFGDPFRVFTLQRRRDWRPRRGCCLPSLTLRLARLRVPLSRLASWRGTSP